MCGASFAKGRPLTSLNPIVKTKIVRKRGVFWAIVRRRPWRMVAETNEFDRGYDLDGLMAALKESSVETFRSESKGILSKYFGREDSPTLFVHDPGPGSGKFTPIESYTPLYERYSQTVRLTRVYCDPDRWEDAQRIAKQLGGAGV